jgi:hypothetical protein
MIAHWTLDDIAWDRFDAGLVDPELLKAVKAASLVEYNAADYVTYLKKVFAGDAAAHTAIEQWGHEEIQHGLALGRWAELADPSFDFMTAFAKFREGYRPPHFENADGSIRGSRAGEMVARCVVESGTTSYYSAMRDASGEPVLREVAGRIAGDEMRHWRLFFDLLKTQPDAKRLSFWSKLKIAATRVNEAEDDELAYAYYCANTPAAEIGTAPYDRKACVKAYETRVTRLYRREHIERAIGMIAIAVGSRPKSWLARTASIGLRAALWWKTRGVRAAEARTAS